MSSQTAMSEVWSHLVSFLFPKFVLFLMSLASGYRFSSVAFHLSPSVKSPFFQLSVRSSSHAHQPHLSSINHFFLSIRLILSLPPPLLLTDGRW